MKPFCLEQALAGAPVVSRDGRKVSEIFHCKTLKDDAYPVLTVVNGQELWVRKDGRSNKHQESPFDLFMAPVKREGWVNLWQQTDGSYRTAGSAVYKTKENALLYSQIEGYVATVKVEWEE